MHKRLCSLEQCFSFDANDIATRLNNVISSINSNNNNLICIGMFVQPDTKNAPTRIVVADLFFLKEIITDVEIQGIRSAVMKEFFKMVNANKELVPPSSKTVGEIREEIALLRSQIKKLQDENDDCEDRIRKIMARNREARREKSSSVDPERCAELQNEIDENTAEYDTLYNLFKEKVKVRGQKSFVLDRLYVEAVEAEDKARIAKAQHDVVQRSLLHANESLTSSSSSSATASCSDSSSQTDFESSTNSDEDDTKSPTTKTVKRSQIRSLDAKSTEAEGRDCVLNEYLAHLPEQAQPIRV